MKTIKELKNLSMSRLSLSVVFMGVLLFLPAGTPAYWEAWVFLVVLFTPVLLLFRYLMRHDPELLERRLRMGEKEESQQLFMRISMVVLLAAFMIPGLDHRFGWSDMPTAIKLIGDALFLGGYGLFFQVLKANSYASRTVEVVAGQQVISTGPYGIVRHPMYASIFVMYPAATLALGSWWATGLIALYLLFFLQFRILDEEKVLLRDLPGYDDYMRTVRWRLVPHIW